MKSFLGDKGGVSATEFAIAAPVLFTLLLGGVEFALVIHTKNSMQSAVRDTARQLSVHTLSMADAPNYLCSFVPSWVQDNCKVEITHTAPNNPTSNVITVSADVPASKASIIGFVLPVIGDFSLNSVVAMQEERI